jgi:hypothetical protein
MAKKLIILIVLAASLVLAGCTPVSPQEVADDATAQVCKDLLLYKTSVDKLLNEEYTDRNALEAQFSVVRLNFTNLVQSIANLKTVETQNFQQAANDLITAYQAVPPDSTVQDTITELKAPIEEVQKAGDQLSTELKCKP